jgi:proteic killer suppression protein
MIKSFRHKGLQQFFDTGSKAGIQAQHAVRLRLQLAKLDTAQEPVEMDLPNWRLHPLKGNLKDHWAVWIDKNWRLTFKFEGVDAILVDYQDYH